MSALQQQLAHWPGLPPATPWALKAIRPPQPDQIFSPGGFHRKARLKFSLIPRIIFHGKPYYILRSLEGSRCPIFLDFQSGADDQRHLGCTLHVLNSKARSDFLQQGCTVQTPRQEKTWAQNWGAGLASVSAVKLRCLHAVLALIWRILLGRNWNVRLKGSLDAVIVSGALSRQKCCR